MVISPFKRYEGGCVIPVNQVKVFLVDWSHRLVRFGRKKPHRRYGERDRQSLSYCLTVNWRNSKN